jgi:mannose-6-phosphate isomerase-like protein (cupin superfamily)
MSDSRGDRRAWRGDYRWEAVDLLAYKETGSAPFRAVTRQILFSDPGLASELRYFEVAAGGHTTLERHGHVHGVTILRGRGQCLVGKRVHEIGLHDLITVPPWTWHQFRATGDEPLGFLCMVNADRDRPQLPTAEDLDLLRRSPDVAAFLDRDEAGRD